MTMAVALPRYPNSSLLDKLRTIQLGIGGHGAWGITTFDRRAAAAASWWLAGGAPTPVAVYQPKGAADLAASYVNLVTPGTYNAAPGTAPTLGADGWAFNGTNQYLTTGIVFGSGWSAVARCASFAISGRRILGANDAANAGIVGLVPNVTPGSTFEIGKGGQQQTFSGDGRTSVLGLADNTGYFNGAAASPAFTGSTYATSALYIGAKNNNGSAGFFADGSVIAIAIWNTSTNHAVWMPAVSAATALI